MLALGPISGAAEDGIRLAFGFTYARPEIDVAIVGMDTVEQVEENVRAADDFVPLSADEERRVLDKALEIARGDKKTLWFLPEERVQGD